MTVELPPMPPRIASLPRDRRGYPIPWFTAIGADGEPDFTAAFQPRWGEAVRKGRCWICGQQLGAFKVFVIGPMCAVNRVSSEPPSHLTCAGFAAVACPFLVKPRMRRQQPDPESIPPPGIMIERNPGVTALWTTRTFKLHQVTYGRPGQLIIMGAAMAVTWYREGRSATLEEVSEAIASGMPILTAEAEKEGPQAMQDLLASVQDLLPLLPREPEPEPRDEPGRGIRLGTDAKRKPA